MGIRVKIGYWLLAIGCWQLFLSGFASAVGMGIRVKIWKAEVVLGTLDIFRVDFDQVFQTKTPAMIWPVYYCF
jgi:hypothetical protein